MGHIQSITVFCGSRDGNSEVYADIAQQTGKMLAEEGLTTLYGGGSSGLMGRVAKGARDAGGEVRGIAPRVFEDAAKKSPSGVNLMFTPDMAERKHHLIADAQVTISLSGGIGTLDEIAETLMFNYLEIIKEDNPIIRPVLLIDPDDLYVPLIAFLQASVERGLSDASVMETIVRVQSVEEARAKIREWQKNPLRVSLAQMPEMEASGSTTPPQRRGWQP
ncbi:MAG: TIGR00730 family Rossman fold protein [Pseudomonadota bacterium]